MLKVAAFYAVFTPVSTILGNMAAEKFNAAENPIVDYLILAVTMIANMVTEYLFQKYVVFRDAMDKKEETKSEYTKKRL